MTKFVGFLASVAAAIGAVSAGNGGVVVTSAPTDTCVLANFETATGDFLALNNLVNIIKASPSLLKQYVSDPLLVENKQLTAQNVSFLGYTFETTPTINSLNVSGITTISPLPVNVTGNNTLSLGTSFTGISLEATLSVEIAQPNHKWYQICWVDLLHPIKCQPKVITVDVALAMSKPEVIANLEANLFECASGVSTSVCHNLTMTNIMTGAMSGDLTSVSNSIYNHFKDAKINSLTLGWDAITNLDFVFHDSGKFVSQITNGLLHFSAAELNKKGDYYRVFLDVAQKLLRSLLNKVIDTQLEPLFGATCL